MKVYIYEIFHTLGGYTTSVNISKVAYTDQKKCRIAAAIDVRQDKMLFKYKITNAYYEIHELEVK